MKETFIQFTPDEQNIILDGIAGFIQLYQFIQESEPELTLDEFIEWSDNADDIRDGKEWVPKFDEEINTGGLFLQYEKLFYDKRKAETNL